MVERRRPEKQISEKAIEEYLRDQVKSKGGKAYKFVSPGNAGVPDRIIVLPGVDVFFVEMKAPGKKPTKLQNKKIAELRALGKDVFVAGSKEAVDIVLYTQERKRANGI